MILENLLNNCRISDRQIGKKIGISGGAVSARILKLEKSGVIVKNTLKVEPPVLGYGVFYVVITGQDTSEILKQIELLGRPFLVVPCIGGISVLGIVVKDNVSEKIKSAKQIMKDVRVLTIFEAMMPKYSFHFTKTDLLIMKELVEDPRLQIEKISEKTGFSSKTVKRCIDKFIESNAFQFTVTFDPIAMKNYIPFVILTEVETDVNGIIKDLESKLKGYFLQKPFVIKNQIVLFFVGKTIFELDEITQKVRNSKGIKSADLFIPKKIIFLNEWVNDAISVAMKSDKLHLVYETN